MTTSRDEIRRQLRAAAADQRVALPRFRRALRRATDPEGGVSPNETAALLGVPHSRRGFLRLGGIGGLGIAASAVLVSCGLDSPPTEGITYTGELPDESTATIPTPVIGTELDSTLLLTASSLEALAIAAYDAALEGGWLGGNRTLIDVATLFRDQHAEHLEAVVAATEAAGITPYTEPNPFLFDNVVGPAAESIAALVPEDQPTATLELAYQLEDVAAQTYTSAGGLFSTTDLRSAAMSIGAVEARHISVILGAQEAPAAPFAFARTVNAVDEAAFITTDGPVTPSEPTTTSTTAGS